MTSTDNIQDLYLLLCKWRLITKQSDKFIKEKVNENASRLYASCNEHSAEA